jgi:Meiotically up-regulated gene family
VLRRQARIRYILSTEFRLTFHSADAIMTFESNYTAYMEGKESELGWTPRDPRKIWHIIYDVPKGEEAKVTMLAKKNNVGLVHITDAKFPNPYDTIPDKDYMDSVIDIVEGGTPLIEDIGPETGGRGSLVRPTASIADFDYTSITLQWDYGASDPYSFAIYSAYDELVRIPGHLRGTTIGNFDPETIIPSITVRAVDPDGNESELSSPLEVTTLKLPGKVIEDTMIYPGKDETIYETNIYIPAGFVRLYLTDSDTGPNYPAWDMAIPKGERGEAAVLAAHYMVEGRTLFKYGGPAEPDSAGHRQWKWDIVDKRDTIKLERNKYHYRWTVPLGVNSEDVDPEYVVVQTEGYGRRTEFYNPCPSNMRKEDFAGDVHYWCKGKPVYDCGGQRPYCSTTKGFKDLCVAASETINPTQNYTSNTIDNGVTFGGKTKGCRIYVQGRDADSKEACTFTGREILRAYNEIHSPGRCRRCGTKHYTNECMVSIDWVGHRIKGLGDAIDVLASKVGGAIGQAIGGPLGNLAGGVVGAAGSFAGGLVGAGGGPLGAGIKGGLRDGLTGAVEGALEAGASIAQGVTGALDHLGAGLGISGARHPQQPG